MTIVAFCANFSYQEKYFLIKNILISKLNSHNASHLTMSHYLQLVIETIYSKERKDVTILLYVY